MTVVKLSVNHARFIGVIIIARSRYKFFFLFLQTIVP